MKISQRLLTYGCALAVVCLLVTSGLTGQDAHPIPNRITQATDAKTRVTLTGNVHPLARAENSRGAVEDSLAMPRILLLLKRSDQQEAALQSLLEAQQDKSSPNYHAWLTPDQFAKQFGPSDTDLQALTDWLTAQGFQNLRVAAGRSVIEFSGSAGQVMQAFATQMQSYAVNGTQYVANSTDPQIPTALAPVVAGVVSLHNFPKKSHARHVGDVQMDAASHKLKPLFTFPFGNGNFYGVGPGDFATIYNTKPLIASGNDGTGQTIAIVGETQINPQDVSDFRTMFGLTKNFSASNIVLNGMDPGITSQGEESESDLDVQWSGAVAPGATVKLVVSAGTPASSGIDLSALYIVEHDLADVISESYGECEKNLGTAGNAFYNALWEQAAAQGITVVVSSGDAGSAGCDDFNNQATATHGLAVSGLSGTPFNVSVGGTDFNQYNRQTTYWNTANDSVTGTSAKGYIPEFPWNENCSQLGLTGCGATAPDGSVNLVAGSGGASSVYPKPTWQMGVAGVPGDNHRDQPDVSLFASPGFEGSGYLFCQADLTGVAACDLSSPTYSFHIIGGTSASAPTFAGMMALVNQYAAAHGGSKRQGNANVTLYALAKKSGASCTSSATEAAGCIFNDVAAVNVRFPAGAASNSVACKGGTPNCNTTVATTNGVLVDPAHTSTEAWTAGAGYDRATGLGTLNANNLAAAWTSASTMGTMTTLSLTPTTGITHGANENVAVSVNVKPNTGTGIAAGDVALLAALADGTKLAVDQFTLVNGAVTAAKTQSLPGGTYTVYAHYAGDGTNAPSDSPSVQVTVGKEASQTFMVIPTFDSQGKQTSGNASSVQYGSNYIIRMYVANNSAVASATGPPSPTCYSLNEVTCPTGNVALTASGTAVDGGTFTLNNEGYTRDIAPTLAGGTYSLVAKYPGDNSYTASTSATDTLRITPAPSSTSLWGPANTPVGASTTMYAETTISVPNGVAPTGTFSVTDNGSPFSGTVSTQSAGGGLLQGNITATFNTVGSHSVTATYSGDASYATSASNAVTIYAQYPVTVSISADSTTVNYGQSVKVTATATATHSSPALAGNLSFYDQIPGTQGPVTTVLTTDGSGNQTMTATFSVAPNGNGYISALYQNDNNYQYASSKTLFLNVNIPDFTLGPASGVSVIPAAGQPGSTQITISPATQTPSTVSMSWYGISANAIVGYTLSLNPQQVSLNGSATAATLSLTPIGSAPQTTIQRNVRRSRFIVLSRGTGKWWLLGLLSGLAAVLVLGLPGRERRYRVALGFSAACFLCFAIGCGGGSASTGGGGGGGGGSTPTATTTTLTTSIAKADQNTPFVLTAKVTGQHPLTGTITIYDNGTAVIGPLSLTNGQAQTTAAYGSIFGVGVHQLSASYSGDTENLVSTAAPMTQAITGIFNIQIQGYTGADGHFLPATVGIQ
jgi:subtilase family serine protease